MTRSVSLGLLPSGPDPVGEGNVHRQPPACYIGDLVAENKWAVGRRGWGGREPSLAIVSLVMAGPFLP